jgi:hypothetical protein
VAPPQFPQGDQIGVAAISRYDANLYAQDTWKISPRFVLDYGLRYELYSPITERAHRTAGLDFVNGPSGPEQLYIINPQPPYRWRGNNWGPRVQLTWQVAKDFRVHAGSALTTIPPNIWQDNLLTGAAPYVDYPRITAAAGAPLPIGTVITPADLPGVFTPHGSQHSRVRQLAGCPPEHGLGREPLRPGAGGPFAEPPHQPAECGGHRARLPQRLSRNLVAESGTLSCTV